MTSFALDRRSPLFGREAELAGAATGTAGRVRLHEMRFASAVVVRLRPDNVGRAEIRATVGLDLPLEPDTTTTVGSTTCLWLGPTEWLVVDPEADPGNLVSRLERALGGRHAAVIDVSASRAGIVVAGPGARELLEGGCSIDLHPRAFATGSCAQTLVAAVRTIVHQLDDEPTYRLLVPASYANHVASWLLDGLDGLPDA